MTTTTEEKPIEVALEDISAERAPAIYGHNKLDAFYDRVAREVQGEAPDLTTKKGRDRIASQAAKVSRSKTAVEKPGRDYLKRIKELPKTIETELRAFTQKMDALRDEVRAPLTKWEEAEEERQKRHKAGIEWFRLRADENRDLDATEIKVALSEVDARIVDASWEDFETEAHRVKARALDALAKALAAREQYEADQAELARRRAADAERERVEREASVAREAEDRARRAAEAQAQAERDAVTRREAEAKAAAERRELELQLQTERAEAAAAKAERDRAEAQQRAERERIEAEQRHAQEVARARQAEVQRQADEAARIDRETRAREADKAHKGKINRATLDAFVAGGMTKACAKQAVTLIAMGKIPAVKINY